MIYKDDDCFRCHHCNKLPPAGMDDKLVEILNDIGVEARDVNSAYRCEAHNAFVGGVPNSFHVQGLAADIDATRFNGVDELALTAEANGADGIGRYYGQNFVHIDTRGYDARWDE